MVALQSEDLVKAGLAHMNKETPSFSDIGFDPRGYILCDFHTFEDDVYENAGKKYHRRIARKSGTNF